MGTNHYWRPPSEKCPTCGHDPVEEVHLGKSSMGWVYTLQAFPDLGITTLDQVVERMGDTPAIFDEYGRQLSLEKWLVVVRDRLHSDGTVTSLLYDPWYLARGETWASFGSDFT